MSPPVEYDDRYRLGIEHFNRGDYFEAHEVWEELWKDCPAAERRFYQSLIQAAVALYHEARGNAAGARRLFGSGRSYMEPYGPWHLGLAVEEFWKAVASRLDSVLRNDRVDTSRNPDDPRPRIALVPAPPSPAGPDAPPAPTERSA